MKAPVFGVVWFESRVATDRDKRTVEFQEIKVTQTQFPNAKPEQERRLATFLNREIAAWPKPTMALDRLLAALAEVEKVKAGANFNNTLPKIIFATVPSVLVLIDGDPILRDVEGFPIKPVTYGYAPVYDPGYGAWNFLAGATFGFIAGAAASNWWGGCGCCGWHGDTNIDINRNVNLSRNYVQNLNINRANLRNANFNRQNYQSLRANRQDFRNNIYKNPNWSQQLQNNRRNQLNQRGERLASGQGARSDRLQDRQARTGERRDGQGAQRQQRRQDRQARPEQRQAAREARPTQQRQASREGARAQRPAGAGSARPEQRASRPADLGRNNVLADRDGNVYRRTDQGWQQRDRNNWSRPETRPQSNFASQRPALDRDYGARARGTERAQNFQRSGGGGFSRSGGGFSRSGGGFSRSGGGGFRGGGGGFRGGRR